MSRISRLIVAALACLALLGPLRAAPAQAADPLQETGTMAILRSMDVVRMLAGAKGKVAVLCFWASWCAPCRSEIPELNTLRAAFDEGELLLVGLSVDEDPVAYSGFVSKTEFAYPVRRAAESVSRLYRVGTIPRLIVYGPDGTLAASHEGVVGAADLKTLVTKLLTEKKS